MALIGTRKAIRRLLLVVARCASYLHMLRGTIQIWRSDYDDSIGHSIPGLNSLTESTLLYNLARGHALLCDGGR